MRVCWRALALGVGAAAVFVTAANAQEDQVFDRIFGAEKETPHASKTGAPNRDDLAIVSVRLGTLTLIEAQPAYKIGKGLCLPVAPVLEALQIDARQVRPGRFEGQIYAPRRTLVLDAEAKAGQLGDAHASLEGEVAPSPDGPCLALTGWAKILPIKATYSAADLRVRLDPTEALPIQERLEREKRRREAEHRPASTTPNFPWTSNPWRLVAAPGADLTLTSEASPGHASSALQIDAAGDLLDMTARVHTTAAVGKASSPARMTLGREGQTPDALPMIGARSFALGDVTLGAQPEITASNAGRGLIITTHPTVASQLFDKVEIRGPLKADWEAELYDHDQLLAWVTKPDAEGDYVFADVQLKVGFNEFRVELYGPHGEHGSRTVTRLLGSEIRPENEVDYTLALVQLGRGVVGPLQTGGGGGAHGWVAAASFERGLTEGLSTRLDMRAPVSGDTAPAGAASLYYSGLGGYAGLTVADDGGGAPMVAVSAQRRLGRALNVAFDAAEFGSGAGSDPAASQDARSLTARVDVKASSQLALGGRSVPWELTLENEELRGGGAPDILQTKLSSSGPWVQWSDTQTLELDESHGQTHADATGVFSANKGLGAWRFRGDLTYAVDRTFALTGVSLAATRRFGPAQLTTSGAVDLGTGAWNFTAGGGRAFGPLNLAANASLSNGGAWKLGVTLSTALMFDPVERRYRFAPSGSAATGLLRPEVFVDANGDGLPEPGETLIKGARFMVNRTLNNTRTGADGAMLVDKIASNDRVDLEVQQSSLDDPDLRPDGGGRSAMARPGEIVPVPIPLVITGEAELNVLAAHGENRSPVSGVTIEAVDAHGRVVARSLSEYDGYVYFEGLAYGHYTLRVAGQPSASVEVDVGQPARKRGKTVLVIADSGEAPARPAAAS